MKRYQFLGWIIERGVAGWSVLDWDYCGESLAYIARSEADAQRWCCERS